VKWAIGILAVALCSLILPTKNYKCVLKFVEVITPNIVKPLFTSDTVKMASSMTS